MHKIFDRVCRWNAVRYEQVYDQQLTVNLLREELTEYYKAATDVQQLDALCDIVYVALGGFWKMNLKLEELDFSMSHGQEVMSKYIEANDIYPVFNIGAYIDILAYDQEYSDALALGVIIYAACVQLSSMGFYPDDVEAALSIVCDANDTKKVQKVASNVKANIDKGEFFRPPEPRLTALLEKVYARNN